MSDQPLSAVDRTKPCFVEERRGVSLKAFDTVARIAEQPVVNIYAGGRLAYTGLLSLAAVRLDISERALVLSIDNSLAIAQPQQPRFYQTPDGRWPRARTYRAKWRDA